MESHAVTARMLTPDQQEAIRYFYKLRWGVGTFFSVFMLVTLSIFIGVGTRHFLPWLGLGLAVAGATNGLRYWLARRKMARAAFIYEYGQPETVVFRSIRASQK